MTDVVPFMDLSVLIVNYNGGSRLSACLTSVAAQLRDVAHEVCVVDNASADGSAGAVSRAFPAVRLLRNAGNRGFAAAMNQALQATTGRYALWLNPDAMLLDEGMKALIRYADLHPEVGIIGPQLLDPDGSVQLSCRAFPSYDWAIAHRHSLLTRWFPNNRYSRRYLNTGFDHQGIGDVDWVSGACVLHRRSLIDDIGGLDERFFMYCEDVDFCLRARARGWAVRYHPGARVAHQIGGSSKQIPRRMLLERHRSLWRYYRKHFPRHPAKDAAAALAICTRCALVVARETVRVPRAS